MKSSDLRKQSPTLPVSTLFTVLAMVAYFGQLRNKLRLVGKSLYTKEVLQKNSYIKQVSRSIGESVAKSSKEVSRNVRITGQYSTHIQATKVKLNKGKFTVPRETVNAGPRLCNMPRLCRLPILEGLAKGDENVPISVVEWP